MTPAFLILAAACRGIPLPSDNAAFSPRITNPRHPFRNGKIPLPHMGYQVFMLYKAGFE